MKERTIQINDKHIQTLKEKNKYNEHCLFLKHGDSTGQITGTFGTSKKAETSAREIL